MITRTLPPDTRADQIDRVAAYLEQNPGATLRDIEAACDTGSATKVLSVMRHPAAGFVLRREVHRVACNDGRSTRRVARFWLMARPQRAQGELFENT